MFRLARIRDRYRRILRSDPLFPLALAAVCGILIGDRLPFPAGFAIAFFVLSFAILVRRSLGSFPALLVAVFCAFAALHGLQEKLQRSFPLLELLESEGVTVSIEGVVIDEPRVFTPTFSGFPVRVTSLSTGADSWQLRHRILVSASGPPPSYGDRVILRGRLHRTEEVRNPGEFDARSYYWRNGFPAELEVHRANDWSIRDSNHGNLLKLIAFETRDWLAEAITRDLENEPEASAILRAIVLGMRGETPQEIEDQFRFSGTLHIFAVSGLHVGMLAYVLWLLLKTIGLPRPTAVLIIIPLLLGYALVTGLRPSAIRAAVMASVFLAAFCFDRQARVINSVGAAALLIVAFDTQQVFLLGFQLSFCVLLAIAVLTRPLQRPFRRFTQPDNFVPLPFISTRHRFGVQIRKRLIDTISVSIAAWIGSCFLIALHFQLITPVAIIANGFLIPLSFAILFTAVMSMVFATVPIFQWAGLLLNNANFLLIKVLAWGAGWFAELPGAHIQVAARPSWIRAPVELTLLDLPNEGACQHLWVGETNTNHLIDTGHSRDFDQRIAPFLKHQGIRQLDALFASHADATHIGAAPQVIANTNPLRLCNASLGGRGASVTALANSAQEMGQAIHSLSAGDRISLGESIYWEVLFPPIDLKFPPPQADNRCLVLRLVTPSWKILLMSDSGFATEKWLLESGMDLRSDVLIKNKHQSDLSGLSEFLNAVQPIAVVGECHGDESLASWALAQGVEYFDQKQTGAIRIELHDDTLHIRGFLGGREKRFGP